MLLRPRCLVRLHYRHREAELVNAMHVFACRLIKRRRKRRQAGIRSAVATPCGDRSYAKPKRRPTRCGKFSGPLRKPTTITVRWTVSTVLERGGQLNRTNGPRA